MTTRAEAEARDAADPLRPFRDRFALPEGVIYLDGNSLGALPRDTPARLAETVTRDWGQGLVGSWNAAGWIDAARRVGDAIAPLVGAHPGEVIVADSTSVNLFKLILAAVEIAPDRRTILTETGNFPTDLHIARRAAELTGRRLHAVSGEAIAAAIDADTALVVLTHVHYKSGRRHDMAALTALARERGTRVLWDLSHSAGAVPIGLAAAGADLAVGCGYKYLNGGPGAPAWLYVREALQGELRSPIAGWFGHAAPFAFGDDYAPAPGIERFQAGTPSILGLAALETGIAQFAGVTMDALWAKSCALFDLFSAQAAARCPALTCISPTDPAQRGSHISFRHDHAYEIVQAAIERGVIGDFRAPDVARFGLTPLYLGYADVWHAVDRLAAILDGGLWQEPRFAVRAVVT